MSEMPSDRQVSFLCDPNLGRLAKWLRIMGFDTVYLRRWDAHLVDEALSSGRIVLTRKRAMARRTNCIVVLSDHIREQLAQVDREFDLGTHARWFTRCNICNETLICVKPENVKDLIAEYVYATQKEFAQCPRCSRIYWKGTHPDKSRDTITQIIASREGQ